MHNTSSLTGIIRAVFVLTSVLGLLLDAPRAGAQASPLGLWSFEGVTKVTACAQGRCQSRKTSVTDFFSVDGDGTFAYGLVTSETCPDAPPILGQWRTKRSGRTILRGTNVGAWWAAVSACDDSGIVIHGRRFAGTMDVDQRTLHVVQPASSTFRGVFVTLRIVGRFTIAPVADSSAGAFVAEASARAAAPLAAVVRALIADVSS